VKSEHPSGKRANRVPARRVVAKSAHRSRKHLRGKSYKRALNGIDVRRLLHLSQQLYAHALTLQEVIRNEGAVGYAALRPRFDVQAAQQFETFYHSRLP
jgi:hypothetical protein